MEALVHVAQAQLAMEQFERAEEVIMKLESIKDTPANVIKDLKTIYDQKAHSLNNKIILKGQGSRFLNIAML